ncbi:MAG: type II toxin-antitoxin system prevent-host-death family antitoxin [Planctomycetota bacterium]
MKTVSTQVAKTRLSQLLQLVGEGEEFIITEAGKPVARLVGIRAEDLERKGSQWKGLVQIHDDFDGPLPDDIVGPL